jgi:hypothetical protein
VRVEGREDALAAMLGLDPDTLDPPEPAIPPVRPLGRDHGAADDLAADLREEIAAPRRFGQETIDAGREAFGIQGLAFGFPGDIEVETNDDIPVPGARVANPDAHCVLLRRRPGRREPRGYTRLAGSSIRGRPREAGLEEAR